MIGKYHPHGDQCDLRRAGAHGAGLLDALAAGRRAGQLRLGRRRPAGGDALHRGAPRAGRAVAARRTSTRTRSTSSRTTTAPSGSRWSCRRSSRTCSSTAPAASPSAWRPTFRRTISARSSTRCIALHRRSRTSTIDELMEHRPGPGLPDRRHHPRPHRHHVRPTRPAAARSSCAATVTVEEIRKDREAIIVTEIPYQVNKATTDREDRRPGARQADRGHLRPPRRDATATACASSSS